jgi:hypothetical protein
MAMADKEERGEGKQSALGSLPLGRKRVGDASKDYGHAPWQPHHARKRQRQLHQARTDIGTELQRGADATRADPDARNMGGSGAAVGCSRPQPC